MRVKELFFKSGATPKPALVTDNRRLLGENQWLDVLPEARSLVKTVSGKLEVGNSYIDVPFSVCLPSLQPFRVRVDVYA